MTTLSGTIKSLETVIDLSIHLELAGKAFYEAATDGTHGELKLLLTSLAEQEGRHAAIYKQLYERMTGETGYSETLVGEYGMYIDLLVLDVTEKLVYSSGLTPDRVVDMALRFEKDTLLYFMEIKALFAGEEAQAVETICGEERQHIQRLMQYQAGMSGK